MRFPIKKLAFFKDWRYTAAVAVIVVIGGYFLFVRTPNLGATIVVTPGDFKEQVSVSGTVIAAKDVDLGFAANGRTSGVYAKVGQRITAGTILAQTENGDLVATLAQAQADLASLLAGTRPEEIAVASAAVTSAEASLVDAIRSAYTVSDDAIHNKVDSFFSNPRTDPEISFTTGNSALKAVVESDRSAIEPILTAWAELVSRLSNANAADSAKQAQDYIGRIAVLLADANAVLNQGLPDPSTSAATLASYTSTLATGRTNVNSAATTLSVNIAALDSAIKSLVLKQAGSTSENIAAQQAVVANAQAALAKTRVIAPFTGTVTRMDAKVGEVISPTTSLISMQSNGVFQIETFVPEVTIARVAVGNPASTTLDAYSSSVEFPATVIAVDPAETVKDGVPTYKTTLSFLAADPRIRSGMTTNVSIETGMLHDAIVIPAGAVGIKNEETYVSVFTKGSATNRTVTIGPSPALGQTQVLSGLTSGDVILLTPVP